MIFDNQLVGLRHSGELCHACHHRAAQSNNPVVTAHTGLMEELRAAQKQISDLKSEAAQAQSQMLITQAQSLPGGTKLVATEVSNMDAKSLQVSKAMPQSLQKFENRAWGSLMRYQVPCSLRCSVVCEMLHCMDCSAVCVMLGSMRWSWTFADGRVDGVRYVPAVVNKPMYDCPAGKCCAACGSARGPSSSFLDLLLRGTEGQHGSSIQPRRCENGTASR